MKRLVSLSAIAFVATLAAMTLAPNRAAAQNAPTVNRKAMERSTWYTAPREIHIVDETPVIRDFREAPSNPGQIALPPGPQAGPGGGHGAGALGPLGGGAPNIPAGGLPIPGGPNTPGYRTAPSSIPSLGSLPKTGFGPSNIPARGMGPRGLLPNGTTQNVLGKMLANKKPVPIAAAAAPAKGLSANPARPVANAAGPAVASYGGNYSAPSSDYGGNGNRAETFVRGSLLRK